MRIEPSSKWPSRLGLTAALAVSFAVTAVMVWPRATLRPDGIAPAPRLGPDTAGSAHSVEERPASAAVLSQDDEPPVTAAPTLQELAVDSDSALRQEAQVLLNLLAEEAAADYRQVD